jgi:LuxR family transcriptional regulator, positive regulator of biofilm formation
MKSESPDNAIDWTAVPQGTLITIAGENAFNNELMASFLNDRTGIACDCTDLDNFKATIDPETDATVLIFLDCTGIDVDDLWSLLDVERQPIGKGRLLVLDHVLSTWRIEHQAISIGVSGMLYDRQDLEYYPRVVRAILDGELWYPRKVLERFLLDDVVSGLMAKEYLAPLTMREREVLYLVATGLTNMDIAKRLCISPHSVKTHTYNIYKKINVSNRLHATLWLSERNNNLAQNEWTSRAHSPLKPQG